MQNSHFKNKKVIITGNTGFKGSWLTAWLLNKGAILYGISKDIPTSPSMFFELKLNNNIKFYEENIINKDATIEIIKDIQPDYVFHLAAQPLLPQSYNDPYETHNTNIIGTLNILEALRVVKNTCSAIFITSDKCYDNVEWTWGYRETDRLGGKDPYSASKGAAEIIIRSHVESFFPIEGNVRIAVGRAGNVIGGGDWAEARIIPDCVKAWADLKTVELRNPNATRPWQHVLEPLGGYLKLALELDKNQNLHGEAFNFGPLMQNDYTVLQLVNEMSRYWENVKYRDSSNNTKIHEAGLLKLNCDKALNFLGWHAQLTFEETMKMTAEWYKSYYSNKDVYELTLSQINEYEKRIFL